MNTQELIESLGGCRVVADLMKQPYINVWHWNTNNRVPARHRVELVKIANKTGLSVKVVDLKC